tara:strand:- start:1388 stop:1690 length:303 start_codon:yes stop_codon:yes gene_type:complete
MNSRNYIPVNIRRVIWVRDCGYKEYGNCQNCNRIVGVPSRLFNSMKHTTIYETCHIGHIVADCNGGGINIENLQVQCRQCNLSIGSKTTSRFVHVPMDTT